MNQNKPYQCIYCDKGFWERHELDIHTGTRHTDIVVRPWEDDSVDAYSHKIIVGGG